MVTSNTGYEIVHYINDEGTIRITLTPFGGTENCFIQYSTTKGKMKSVNHGLNNKQYIGANKEALKIIEMYLK